MKRTARNIISCGSLAFVLLLLGLISGPACNVRETAASRGEGNAAPTADSKTQIARGQYLVTISGCHDCHTPLKMGATGPEPDMSRMLSGHPEQMRITKMAASPGGEWQHGFTMAPTMTAFSGPWGVSFAANLTPDQNTGLGIWTEEMFLKALRTGKHYGVSRPILPPMPWQNLKNMTDDDLKAMFAYLRSIPPVTNHVPDPIPPAAAPTNE